MKLYALENSFCCIKLAKVIVLNISVHILNTSGLHMVIVLDLLLAMTFSRHHVKETQGSELSTQMHVVYGMILVTRTQTYNFPLKFQDDATEQFY